jgi:hypothetical protein
MSCTAFSTNGMEHDASSAGSKFCALSATRRWRRSARSTGRSSPGVEKTTRSSHALNALRLVTLLSTAPR